MLVLHEFGNLSGTQNHLDIFQAHCSGPDLLCWSLVSSHDMWEYAYSYTRGLYVKCMPTHNTCMQVQEAASTVVADFAAHRDLVQHLADAQALNPLVSLLQRGNGSLVERASEFITS